MPPETRAELVGGVVYMPSPMRRDHGTEGRIVAGWLFYYQLKTPGVEGADGATVKLDQQGEPQPDCQLHIAPELGGQIRYDPERLFCRAPGAGRRDRPLQPRLRPGSKKADYERAGVQEYVVVELDPDQIHWFIRRDDRFRGLASWSRRRLSLGGFPRPLARSGSPVCQRQGQADRCPAPRPGDSRTRGVPRAVGKSTPWSQRVDMSGFVPTLLARLGARPKGMELNGGVWGCRRGQPGQLAVPGRLASWRRTSSPRFRVVSSTA